METQYKEVDALIRWNELFKPEMLGPVRRERWETWKAIASAKDQQGKEMVDFWSKDHVEETCSGCKHRHFDWCRFADLPCNVNPILTISYGTIGMACKGTGYEKEK